MEKVRTSILGIISILTLSEAFGQDTVRYVGDTRVNIDYHHGQLVPAIGIHSYQTLRANRSASGRDSVLSWTYNHAPMLAYWKGNFYLTYLSNPVGEHVPPGRTLMQTSRDGVRWSKPVVIFPPYRVPDGTTKDGYNGIAKKLFAVMHQRMGFYTSKTGKLLALGYYGIALDAKDDPNDGKGIGRVVREILGDGRLGPIYFIRHNASWKQKSDYPMYTASADQDFVKACDELLANKLVTQQWAEEADRNDPLISLKGEYKALSYYHLVDGRVVGLWKNALTSISIDQGKSWRYLLKRAPGFVNSNAKIWGQKTSDGNFATVYNPSEFRWPLAISTSTDGLRYQNLLLANGEITSMRYGGNFKSYGPQYVRGIAEGDGTPPDGKLWVAYSMNKEDIWVSAIPVPVISTTSKHSNDRFGEKTDGNELDNWNVYSPVLASVGTEKGIGEGNALVLKDSDPFDYAKAERVIPISKKLTIEMAVTPMQENSGQLDIEFLDAKGNPGIRLTFDSTGVLRTKAGYRNKNLSNYQSGKKYVIQLKIDVAARMYTISINGESKGNNLLFAPLESIQRIAFRTGDTRRFPDADTPTDQMYDLPGADKTVKEAIFKIGYLNTKAF